MNLPSRKTNKKFWQFGNLLIAWGIVKIALELLRNFSFIRIGDTSITFIVRDVPIIGILVWLIINNIQIHKKFGVPILKLYSIFFMIYAINTSFAMIFNWIEVLVDKDNIPFFSSNINGLIHPSILILGIIFQVLAWSQLIKYAFMFQPPLALKIRNGVVLLIIAACINLLQAIFSIIIVYYGESWYIDGIILFNIGLLIMNGLTSFPGYLITGIHIRHAIPIHNVASTPLLETDKIIESNQSLQNHKQKTSEMRFCMLCGIKLPPGAVFCPGCSWHIEK